MYFLTVNQRDYILQELALIHGCIPNGLLFEVTNPQEQETVYMVYPREEDRAFAVGKKLLEQYNGLQKNPLPFEVKPLEINLHETGLIQRQKHYQANIVKPSIIEDLLLAKTKRLLFLISVGQEYHENNCLEATVNLFANIIKGCVALMKEEEKSGHSARNKNPHPRLKNINGEWQIRVLVADSLQAYNEASVEEGRKKYLPMGKKWKDAAKKVFQQLTEACGKDIKLSLEFVRWDKFLAKSEKFAYLHKYQFLLDQYLTGAVTAAARGVVKAEAKGIVTEEVTEAVKAAVTAVVTGAATRAVTGAAEFYSAAVDKGYDHRKRQLKKEEANLKKLSEIETRQDVLQDCEKEPVDIASQQKEKYSDKSKRKTYQVVGISGGMATDPSHLKEQQRLIKCVAFDLNPALSDNHFQIFDDKFNPPKFDLETYTERKEFSAKIKSTFSAPASDLRHVVLVGDGGMGKTSLAASYYHSSVQYSHRIWIAGNNLQYSFKSIGEALGVLNEKNQQNWKKIIIDWLTQNYNWLLVIDSNSDIDDFIQRILSLSTSCGHIILTARHRKNLPEQNVKVLSVDAMSAEEAKELLKRTSHRLHEDFSALASQLRHLPIALKTAGAHLAANPGMTVSQYCEHKEFDNALQDKSFNKGIAATFNISILAIDFQLKKNKKEAPIPFSRELLTVCSYLAADDIPTELLRLWFAKKYPGQSDIFDEVCQQLLKHALIHEESSGLIRIHPVLQDFMCAQVKKNKAQDKIENEPSLFDEALSILLEFSNKPVEYIYYQEHVLLVQHLEAALKHASLSRREAVVEILLRLGRSYQIAVGNPVKSNQYLHDLLGLLNVNSSDLIAEISLLIAKNYRELQGKENIAESIRFATKALTIYVRQNPQNVKQLAATYKVLINGYAACWDIASHSKQVEYSITLIELYLNNPQLTATNDKFCLLLSFYSMLNPKTYLNMRSIKRIVKNYIAVLRLIMQDSDQANNCNLMIMADKLENLPANTRQEYIKNLFFIFEENISIFKIIFQDNPKYNIDFYIVLSLLAALSSGAYTVSDRDKRLLEKAVGYGHTALIIWEREVKVDHPKLAFIHQVMATAAEVIEDNGYGHIACECFSKSLNIYVRNLGERHPSSLYAYCMLVQAQAYQDQRFGAEQIFLAIQKIKQALPELIQQEHRSLLHIYYAVLARLYIKLGAIAHRVEIINYLRLFKQSLRESDGSPELIALTSAGASFTILLLLLVQFFVAPGRSLHECGITFFHKATHLDPIEASAMSLSGLIAGCSPGFMWESPTIDSLTFSTLIIHRSLLCLKLPTINANSASVQYKIGIAVVLANLAIKLLEFTFNANKCFLGLTFVAIGLISIVNHILNYKNDNNTQPQFKPR